MIAVVLAVEPSALMLKYLEGLKIPHEVVKSAADLDDYFENHKGFFHGIIAPNNAEPQKLRKIGEHRIIKLRELPIVVFGSALAVKRRLSASNSTRIKLAYRGSMRAKLKAWYNGLCA